MSVPCQAHGYFGSCRRQEARLLTPKSREGVLACSAPQHPSPGSSVVSMPLRACSGILWLDGSGSWAFASGLGAPEGRGAWEERGLAVLTLPLWVLGFRLFFTSVPEGPEEKAAPQPRRKRLPSRSR